MVDGAFQEVGYCFLTSAQARLISDGLKTGVGGGSKESTCEDGLEIQHRAPCRNGRA